jgi:hypothetical protein
MLTKTTYSEVGAGMHRNARRKRFPKYVEENLASLYKFAAPLVSLPFDEKCAAE